MLDIEQKLREIRTMDVAAHQLRQMQTLISFHYHNNPVYRRKCLERKVAPEDIKSLDDVRHLPIIERDYLVEHAFFHEDPTQRGGSIPARELLTYLNSCGSTGKPKRIPIAAAAAPSIFDTTAIALWIAGVRGFQVEGGGPILPITLHGPSAGCFFMQNGAERIGFAPKCHMELPFDWHYDNLVDLDARYVITTPSYIAALGKYIQDHGDFERVHLDTIVLGGEYFAESFRTEISKLFNAKVLDIYGCAEAQIIGVESAKLCAAHPGHLHHLAQMSYIEVVEPGTDRLLGPGEEGEILVSVFNRRAWPVIRYRMGDVVSLPAPNVRDAELGLPMMSRIRGRVDDRLNYGSTVIGPQLVFGAIDKFNRRRGEPVVSSDKFRVTIDADARGKPTCNLRVERVRFVEDRAAAEVELLACLYRENAALERDVTRQVVSAPAVEIVEPGALYVKEQKLKRFVDARSAGGQATIGSGWTAGTP